MFDELVKYTNNIVLSLIPVESACECYPHLSVKLFLRVLGTYLLILSYIADDWRLMIHDS